jgi:hypothetical protein
MILGWFTEIPCTRGRDGTRIRESGSEGHIFRSDSASGLASSAVSVGAGDIGDITGVAATRCMAAADTSPGAIRFTTGAITTVGESRAEEVLSEAVPDSVHSTGTQRRLEDSLRLVDRPAFARGPSAATRGAVKQGAFRHAEAPASVAVGFVEAAGSVEAAEGDVAAVDTGNGS